MHISICFKYGGLNQKGLWGGYHPTNHAVSLRSISTRVYKALLIPKLRKTKSIL